jgi:glycosyltransferase involved in cell wall biosynthesis
MAGLRVLVVEPGHDLGGAQLYVLRLAPLLRERGVEQVLAAPAGSELAHAWRAEGGEHVSLETPTERSIRRADGRLDPIGALREAGRTLSSARRIAALARQTGANVLHANGHWTHLEVAAAARICRRPAVLHLHEQSQNDALGRLRALGVWGAAATVSVSNAVTQSLPSWAGKRLHMIHSGIDTRRFSPGPSNPALRSQLTNGDPDAQVVLVLARLVSTKGVDHVVRAVAGLRTKLDNTHLVIAGAAVDPAYEQSLRQLGGQLLGDRIHVLGPRDDVDELLRASDALVLASESEGFGLCILEAQACGIPAVAYPAGGCAELIRHDFTGLLAEQGNVQDLGHQLGRLLTNPALAKDLATNALQQVLAHHSFTQQADKNVDILRTVVSTRRLRVPSKVNLEG